MDFWNFPRVQQALVSLRDEAFKIWDAPKRDKHPLSLLEDKELCCGDILIGQLKPIIFPLPRSLTLGPLDNLKSKLGEASYGVRLIYHRHPVHKSKPIMNSLRNFLGLQTLENQK